MKNIAILVLMMFLTCETAFTQNISIENYRQAKSVLEEIVYTNDAERITLYCNAKFNEEKATSLPDGFVTTKYKKRANRIEWEHVVPAENFGRTFIEWREGHPLCVDKKGKSFKGRKCAELVNEEYRLMASDLHNLYPAIGAVNASRSNYNFAMLSDAETDFGTCEMKIDSRKAEPPISSRGKIARAYLYMEATYPRYKMSKQQKQLMLAWDKMYPVTKDEILRNERILKIQGNMNNCIAKMCL